MGALKKNNREPREIHKWAVFGVFRLVRVCQFKGGTPRLFPDKAFYFPFTHAKGAAACLIPIPRLDG
jgi:hypothetical protein